MNFIGHHKLYGLQTSLGCSEGTLQSHDSCFDARAWSHDMRQRDRYLREWIKCDMSPCIVPINTIVSLFAAITCKSRSKATPRCHPDCKSKSVLDSITISCEAMRECLKADQNMAKFLCEEDIETSTWPCERCLESLKNIKMFWRILLERVFAINLTKTACPKHDTEICKSVHDVARMWQRDMVQQAIFVKSIMPQLCSDIGRNNSFKKSCLKKSSSLHLISPPCAIGDTTCKQIDSCKDNPSKCTKKVTLNFSREKLCKRKRSSKCVSTFVSAVAETVDAYSTTTGTDRGDSQGYKASIESLQKTNSYQQEEIDRLIQENKTLQFELQKLKYSEWQPQPIYCATAALVEQEDQDSHSSHPCLHPSDSYISDDDKSYRDSVKGAESELLITMKNCKHESYKHVSLLQVLHKTNNPSIQEEFVDKPCYKDEDPMELLSKVQETLGAMVKREMILATTKQRNSNDSEIEASFQRISACQPSSSVMSIRID
ncbi:hypothetical protein NE865_07919 [Phthorimaea operculella]|nr:hypothetical protein NE865_07919 [Phthorimaea operculella]